MSVARERTGIERDRWRPAAYVVAFVATSLFCTAPGDRLEAAPPERAKPPHCAPATLIKGNVSRGKRRYYLPSHRSYARVKINRRGERWFCTESEAVAAGFRPAAAAKSRLRRAVADAADFIVPDDAPSRACSIKGNVSRDAKRYHVLGTPYYAETKVEPRRGDQWFCSEGDARAKGFERAGRYVAGRLSRLDRADCSLPDAPERPPGCTIKGNINSRKVRIYHVRGSQYYAETTVTRARGERWFCTEAEAVAAGWRAPRRAREPLACEAGGAVEAVAPEGTAAGLSPSRAVPASTN
ncbi:MAG: hypothetical protein AAFQ42_02410 [Pseudomonadota bacterium]